MYNFELSCTWGYFCTWILINTKNKQSLGTFSAKPREIKELISFVCTTNKIRDDSDESYFKFVVEINSSGNICGVFMVWLNRYETSLDLLIAAVNLKREYA